MLPLVRRGLFALALVFAVLSPLALFHAGPPGLDAWRESLFGAMTSHLAGLVQAGPSAPAQPSWALITEAAAAVIASLLVWLLMIRRRPLLALGAFVLAGLLFAGAAALLFIFRLDLLDPVSPLVLVAGSLLLSGAAMTLGGGGPARARVSKTVDRREVTALVLTIRDMPALIELHKDEPAAIARIVAKLFGTAAEIAAAHRGSVEQAGPDRLVAVFGAQGDNARHAEKAAEAALAMLGRLEPINDALEKSLRAGGTFTPLQISIGLATADAIVGPLLPAKRTGAALGPALDTASRLATDAERYGPAILANARTRELASRTFALLEIGLAEFPGGAEDAIFALLGNPVLRVNPRFKALQEGFAAFHAAYRKGSWAQANQLLAHCAKLPGASPRLIGLYERRIRALAAGPPRLDWNGIIRPQID